MRSSWNALIQDGGKYHEKAYSLQHLLPESVALVCSVKDNSNSAYSLSAQGMAVISKCTAIASAFHPHPNTFFPLFKKSSHVILDDDT